MGRRIPAHSRHEAESRETRFILPAPRAGLDRRVNGPAKPRAGSGAPRTAGTAGAGMNAAAGRPAAQLRPTPCVRFRAATGRSASSSACAGRPCWSAALDRPLRYQQRAETLAVLLDDELDVLAAELALRIRPAPPSASAAPLPTVRTSRRRRPAQGLQHLYACVRCPCACPSPVPSAVSVGHTLKHRRWTRDLTLPPCCAGGCSLTRLLHVACIRRRHGIRSVMPATTAAPHQRAVVRRHRDVRDQLHADRHAPAHRRPRSRGSPSAGRAPCSQPSNSRLLSLL